MTQRLRLLCLALLIPLSMPADEIDNYVNGQLKEQNIPGLALGIIKDGKLIKAQGYGYANLEHQVPVTADTVFQGGSIGKMFTASAIMLLVEDGQLRLEDPVQKYIKKSPSHWKGITIRHLLNHTSGIPNFPYSDPEILDLQDSIKDEGLIKLAATSPLDFQPGEEWSYSNTGYVLLGIIINRITGKHYGEFLQKRLLKPLGMTSSQIINERSIIPHRAAGYEPEGKHLYNQSWVSPAFNSTADGSLYFTINDFAKWDIALGSGKPLSSAILAQMWAPTLLNDGSAEPYGYGWELDDFEGHKCCSHSGSWQGFTSLYARFPDKGLSIVIFCNTSESELYVILKEVTRLSLN